MKPKVLIYTDGAERDGNGGWAASIFYGHQTLNICGNAKNTTNSRMELTAVIKALKRLTISCDVELRSDSKYVVNGLNLWLHTWVKNSWHADRGRKIANIDLWKELNELKAKHKVIAKWVKAHNGVNGDKRNETVDKLAVLMRCQLDPDLAKKTLLIHPIDSKKKK